MAPYDVVGNIVIVKFSRETSAREKKRFAAAYLAQNASVRTVVEKTSRIKGRLRTPETRWIAGEKTKEALYKENGCEFRLNVDTCYFSPRLSSERKHIASIVKKGERVLVMFGGVGPFSIVIAKQKKAREVVSVELGKEPHRYALENVKRNKTNVICLQGDVRRKVPSLDGVFDRIVMARPNLEDHFLDVAFKKIKKKGIIHYYGFYEESQLDVLRVLILEEAKKLRKNISILRITKAGDIGTRKYRYRVDIKVLE